MAEPARVIEFKLPKRKPKVVEKVAPPDQRKFVVMPIKALTDKRLTDNQVRIFGVLCSYANRAGLTWVSQARIGQDLGISQQAVAKQIKALVKHGFIEVTSKGFRGERANTIRVIFDQDISQEDAIAVASSKEDSRPPEQIKREAKQMTTKPEEPEFTEEQMAANRARLRELLGGLAGRDGNHHYNKPERISDIMARKPRAKTTPKEPNHSQPNTVVNEDPLHTQPHSQPNGVVQTQKNIDIREVLMVYEYISKELKTYVVTTDVDMKFAEILCELGCKTDRFEAACRASKSPKRLAEICEELIHG
jgi:biotin operon repressor